MGGKTLKKKIFFYFRIFLKKFLLGLVFIFLPEFSEESLILIDLKIIELLWDAMNETGIQIVIFAFLFFVFQKNVVTEVCKSKKKKPICLYYLMLCYCKKYFTPAHSQKVIDL